MLLRAQAGLETLPVQGSVYAIMSRVGNATVQIGAEGPLVVDTQPAASSELVIAAVRALTSRPIRHIVLTSGDAHSAGGAASLSKAGRYVRVIDSIDPRGGDTRASIIAHLNVLNRMTAGGEASGSWPTETYLTPDWSLFSNGEAVQFFHVAGRAYRWRHDRLLPPLGRREHGRRVRRRARIRGSIRPPAAASTGSSRR